MKPPTVPRLASLVAPGRHRGTPHDVGLRAHAPRAPGRRLDGRAGQPGQAPGLRQLRQPHDPCQAKPGLPDTRGPVPFHTHRRQLGSGRAKMVHAADRRLIPRPAPRSRRVTGHRQTLPGDHGLVDLGRAALHRAVEETHYIRNGRSARHRRAPRSAREWHPSVGPVLPRGGFGRPLRLGQASSTRPGACLMTVHPDHEPSLVDAVDAPGASAEAAVAAAASVLVHYLPASGSPRLPPRRSGRTRVAAGRSPSTRRPVPSSGAARRSPKKWARDYADVRPSARARARPLRLDQTLAPRLGEAPGPAGAGSFRRFVTEHQRRRWDHPGPRRRPTAWPSACRGRRGDRPAHGRRLP